MARTAVIAGTATAVSGSVAQRQAAEAQAARTTPSPAAAVPTAAGPPAAGNALMVELERLVELRQQGLLTDDEFTALKARLIAS